MIVLMIVAVYRSSSAQQTTTNDSVTGASTSRRLQTPQATPSVSNRTPIPTNGAEYG
jgi:hypothetical protein